MYFHYVSEFSGPLYPNEVKYSAFNMEMSFHSYSNKTHFHKKGCALGLSLKVRVLGTRKWPFVIESFWRLHVPQATQKSDSGPQKHPHGAIRQNTNLKEVSPVSDILNLVPRRSLLTHSPCEVWERVGESLSVTSQFTVESRLDRAEYAEGQG